MAVAPFIPGDQSLAQSELPDKAVALSVTASALSAQLSPLTLATLEPKNLSWITKVCTSS